jgi:hypothetical protein
MLREDIERDEQLANEKRTDAQDRESGGATA